MRINLHKHKKKQPEPLKIGDKDYYPARLQFAFGVLLRISNSIIRDKDYTLEEIVARSGLEDDICKDVLDILVENKLFYQREDKYYMLD